MKQFEVELALQEIAESRQQWHDAHRDFDRTVGKVMNRLLHEAAANRMSVEQVAKHSGIPKSRIRLLMRGMGLDLRWSKGLLAESAAKALRENAELLGVDPPDMDLTSPLAYLPMGSDLRNKLQSEAVKGVKEIPDKHTCSKLEIIQGERGVWFLRCPECDLTIEAADYLYAFRGFIHD